MVKVNFKTLIGVLAVLFTFVSYPVFAIVEEGGGAPTWTKMNITFYVPTSMYGGSGISAKIKRTCTAGVAIAGSTCPSVGYFEYTLDKVADPTATLGYYKFYKAADRGSSSLPAAGWVLNYRRSLTASQLALEGVTNFNYSYNIPSLGEGVAVTLSTNGTFSSGSPTPTTTNPDGTSTGGTNPGGTTNTTTQTAGDLTASFNADITPADIDDSKCPNDFQTITRSDGTTEKAYSKGILKGVSCERATKSLEDVLLIVKNIVTTLLLPTVGVLFIIMLLIGGILYISSAGNQKQVDRGKAILTAAVIGLLIVILSYTLIAIFTNIIGGGIAG
jgi:hypothetical protein